MECISVLRSTAKLHWMHEEQREALIFNVEPNCGKRKSLFAARRNILQRVRGVGRGHSNSNGAALRRPLRRAAVPVRD